MNLPTRAILAALLLCSACAADAPAKPKPKPAPASQPAPLPAGILGTAGSWGDDGNTADKALDGNTATFFDAPVADNAWVGRDQGSAKPVAGFKVYPRANFAQRMIGGRFQVADRPDFADAKDVGTLGAVAPGAWTTLNLPAPVTGRYWRYVAPRYGYGNVAEVVALAPAPATVPATVPTTVPATQPQPPATPPVVTPPTTTPATQPAARLSRFGVNIGGFMNDLVKDAEAIGPLGAWWTGQPNPPYDADGWATADFTLRLWWDKRKGMGGDYDVTFTGKADVKAWYDATITQAAYDAATNVSRATLTVKPDAAGGSNVAIDFRNTNGAVKNVKVVPAGTGAKRYNAAVVARVRALGGPVRMLEPTGMNWKRVAWQRTFAERAVPTDANYRQRGTPVEDCAGFAAEARVPLLLQIPANADADFVRRAVRLARMTLPAELPLYVELGNELWNTAGPYSSSQVVAAYGNARGMNIYEAAVAITADAADAALDGAKGLPGKVVPVLGVQVAGLWSYDWAVGRWEARTGRKIRDVLPVWVGAPYAAGSRADLIACGNDPAAIAAFLVGKARTEIDRVCGPWAPVLAKYGAKLAIYEAGTDVDTRGLPNADAYLAAMRLPAMREYTRVTAERLAANGCVWWCYNGLQDPLGNYGLLWAMDDTTAPKWLGAADAAAAYPME